MRIFVFEGMSALPTGEKFLPGEAVALDVGEGVREAAYLGMRPDEGQLAPGPLIVSALKADPPERSTHFHLALLSIDDEGIVHRTDGELEEGVTEKLRTSSLVALKGFGKDHALVWEDIGSLKVVPPREALGKSWLESLPEGDGERILRRLIDDSVNLLRETETNRRLIDLGKRPANLLWPWGAGLRLPVPNLPLRRLKPGTVSSKSWRLAGLSRLTGYRHGPWHRSVEQSSDLTVTRLPEDPDEALYDLHRWRDSMEPQDLAIVLTNGSQATGIRTDREPNGTIFDERLLQDERRLSLWTWLDEAWTFNREL